MARPKGSPNKIPRALKEMILASLQEAGGQAYLTRQARENPSGYLTLIGKVLPLTIQGDKDNPLEHRVTTVERVIVKASD